MGLIRIEDMEFYMYDEIVTVQDDLFDRCVRKGLIEKTACGYYFTPEFFETLDIYDED